MVKLPGHTEERERAKQLNIPLDTLRKKRKRGQTQAYVIFKREIHYVDADEPRWLASLKVVPPRREAEAPASSPLRRGRPPKSASSTEQLTT
jgi:hypothetical protein